MAALTDRTIRNLKAGAKDQFISDGHGLYLRVSVSGAKTWVFRSRVNGKARWRTLGLYPVMGLLTARNAVLSLAGRELPQSVSVEQAVAAWESAVVSRLKRPDLPMARVNLHLRGVFKKNVADVSRSDLSGVLTTLARTSPVQANRLLTDVKGLSRYCVERGWIDGSPAELLTRRVAGGREKSRDRVMTESELTRLVAELSTERFAPATRLALALCLLTGQRSGEVRGLEHVYVVSTSWRLPGHLTKNGVAHQVDGGVLLTFILRLTFKLLGSKPFDDMAPQVLNRAMDRIGFTPKATPHDLRRTMVTWMAENGVAPHIVERCLNHKLPGVAGIYNHAQYEREKTAAWRL